MEGGPLKVTVRFFALYRERAGTARGCFTLSPGATLGQLVETVRGRYPDLAPPHVEVVAAVNTEYAEAGVVLQDGDEVALIPPVSGGGRPGPPAFAGRDH